MFWTPQFSQDWVGLLAKSDEHSTAISTVQQNYRTDWKTRL